MGEGHSPGGAEPAPPHLPSGPWSHHKWPLNLGLINAIKGTSILLLASFEVKHRCHLLPAQPWVSSSREGDNIIGVVVVRPLLLGAQAAEHMAQVKGGAITPRVAGVGDVGFSGRALEARQGGVRWDSFLLEDSPRHYPAMPKERMRATTSQCAPLPGRAGVLRTLPKGIFR